MRKESNVLAGPYVCDARKERGKKGKGVDGLCRFEDGVGGEREMGSGCFVLRLTIAARVRVVCVCSSPESPDDCTKVERTVRADAGLASHPSISGSGSETSSFHFLVSIDCRFGATDTETCFPVSAVPSSAWSRPHLLTLFRSNEHTIDRIICQPEVRAGLFPRS